MLYTGVVSNVSSFDYQGKKLWSFQLNNDKGVYYRTGSNRVKAEVGQFVSFLGEPGKNGSVNVDSKSVEVKQGEQSATGLAGAVAGAGSGAGKGTPVSTSRDFPTKAERDATQKRIEIQSCRNSALEFIDILIRTEAFKVPAKNKVEALEQLLSHYIEKFLQENSGDVGKTEKVAEPTGNPNDETVPY